MTDVKFLRGTSTNYTALTTKDDKTFYYLTDTNQLFLGSHELTTESSVKTAVNLVNNGTKGNEALYTEIAKLEGSASTEGSIAYLLAALKSTIEGEVVNTLTAADNSVTVGGTATARTVGVKISSATGNSLELANDGLKVIVPAATDYTVSITESTPEGVAKRYTVAQGPSGSQTTIGTIDIPKDMVVESGSVVDITYSDGKLYDGATDVTSKIKGTGTATAADAGKYIKLEIANSSSDVLYIAAKDLVDVYTAQQNATQVQLAIDSSNVISATIVAGSIGTTELSSAVNTSLGKADSALQSSSIAEGSTNGTIAVSGTDIAVHGLGSAAYTASTDYATAAQGAKADSAIQSVAEGATNGTVSVDGTDVAVHGLGSAAYTNSSAYDAAGSAAAAETAAKSYTDTALTWGTIPAAE